MRSIGYSSASFNIVNIFFAFLFVFVSMIISGCEPSSLVITTTLLTGNVASQDRGLEGVIGDNCIKSHIYYLWLERSSDMFSRVQAIVTQGNVVLTGIVSDNEMHREAIRIAWQAPGVRSIVSKIEVQSDDENNSAYIEDALITANVIPLLLGDERINGNNYSVCTCDRVVYLIGISSDKDELACAIEQVSKVAGVRKIVVLTTMKKS